MLFGCFWGIESIWRVFEAKWELVYYDFGSFGGKNGLKMAQNGCFWAVLV